MSWRFKPSKYKNAVPVAPKREQCITNAPVYAPQTHGSPVAASAALMAFVTKNRGGGSVAVLPIDYTGRYDGASGMLPAHSDYVSDMCFSPFDDGLLATCSADNTVRVWSLPETGSIDGVTAEVEFNTDGRRADLLHFHPIADCLLTASFGQSIRLYDILHQRHLYTADCHPDHVQSFTWRGDGSCLASTCRDAALRVIDPRAGHVTDTLTDCTGSRGDSRVVWLGLSDQLVISGFDNMRHRMITLRDVRRLDTPVHSLTLDHGSNAITTLFDDDTKMLFLVGKGASSFCPVEVVDKDPYFVECLKYSGEETKGVCLVPKRAMDVTSGEVNRLLQMTSSSIVPLSFKIMRKVSSVFHADLYPDTIGCDPSVSALNWWEGDNRPPRRVSLDPSKVTITDLRELDRSASSTNGSNGHHVSKSEPNHSDPKMDSATDPKQPGSKSSSTASSMSASTTPASNAPASVSQRAQPAVVERHERKATNNNNNNKNGSSNGSAKPQSGVVKPFRRVNKCRYMTGKPVVKAQQFENLKNLDKSTANECDAIHANALFAAILLGGPGGKLALIDMKKPGRLPDGVMPCLVNGTKVMDFRFDPFDDRRIAAACDDGVVRIWRVPDSGLTCQLNQPDMSLAEHSEKVLTLAFHPLAEGVLATVSLDARLLVWHHDTVCLEMETLNDQVSSMCWSPCGRYLAALCRDGMLRVYEPRASSAPVQCAEGHRGSRGGRLVYVLDGEYIVSTGFSKSSQRQLRLYKSTDISVCLTTLVIDTAPAILMCHYDPGTSTLFLTSKGATSIMGYEVASDAPFFYPLAPFKQNDCHQGAAFLPKHLVDVKSVEFARCIRLTSTCLTPVSFTVPRVKATLFQDDLFPPVPVTWKPTLTGKEWLQGVNRQPDALDLCPDGMQRLSENVSVPTTKATNTNSNGTGDKSDANGAKNDAFNPDCSFAIMADHARAKELENSLNKVVKMNLKLEQDDMEGVAEEEWNED